MKIENPPQICPKCKINQPPFRNIKTRHSSKYSLFCGECLNIPNSKPNNSSNSSKKISKPNDSVHSHEINPIIFKSKHPNITKSLKKTEIENLVFYSNKIMKGEKKKCRKAKKLQRFKRDLKGRFKKEQNELTESKLNEYIDFMRMSSKKFEDNFKDLKNICVQKFKGLILNQIKEKILSNNSESNVIAKRTKMKEKSINNVENSSELIFEQMGKFINGNLSIGKISKSSENRNKECNVNILDQNLSDKILQNTSFSFDNINKFFPWSNQLNGVILKDADVSNKGNFGNPLKIKYRHKSNKQRKLTDLILESINNPYGQGNLISENLNFEDYFQIENVVIENNKNSNIYFTRGMSNKDLNYLLNRIPSTQDNSENKDCFRSRDFDSDDSFLGKKIENYRIQGELFEPVVSNSSK